MDWLVVVGLAFSRRPVNDKTLKLWLDEFRKVETKKVYCSALRRFKSCLGIESLEEYLGSQPDASADLRRFLVCLEGRPSKTVSTYVVAVRVFFMDHGIKLKENDWRKMRRRGFMPKRVRALTHDKKPSKVMLKRILNYGDIKLKALVLYLVSSGGRVGETLCLKVSDFDFDVVPPRVHIRAEYTKAGIGERTAYFSYEARDVIKDWLRIKAGLRKRSGEGTYGDERVFPFNSATARFMWNKACDRAGYGERDQRTDRRIYHLHSLRKFFRSNVGLELDVIHALMGHGQYLDDAYLRLEEKGEIAKSYLDCMHNVSVYAVEDLELREKTEGLVEENKFLLKKLDAVEKKLKILDNPVLLELLRRQKE